MTKERIAKFCEKFNTHKATLIQDTDRYLIIDWRRADGSGDYYVNYIVDKKRGNLIVSGDLGEYGNNGKGPVWWLPKEIMWDKNNIPDMKELEQMKDKLLRVL